MKSQKNYSREIIVSTGPHDAYLALTEDIDKWWVAPEGKAEAVGDNPEFRFGESFWKMNVKELIPDKQITWECIEAHHLDEGLPKGAKEEWTGTTLKWKITKDPNGTKICFVHEGLDPSLGCYKICKEGWDYFFVDSLKRYLNSGKGKPFNGKSD